MAACSPRSALCSAPASTWSCPGTRLTNPWLQAFAWIRINTPTDAYFAMDPHYLEAPGEDYHSFRALAERSQLADAVKDTAVVTQVPELGPAWEKQVDAQAGWRKFQARRFRTPEIGVWRRLGPGHLIRSPQVWPATGTMTRSPSARFLNSLHTDLPHASFCGLQALSARMVKSLILRRGDRHMLNLTQRLILGCVLLAALTAGSGRRPRIRRWPPRGSLASRL